MIGVCIANWNNYHDTLETLFQLNNIDCPKLLYIVVVDDCSTNESANKINQFQSCHQFR